MAWQGGDRSYPSWRLLGGRARAPRLPQTVSPWLYVPFRPARLEAPGPGKHRLKASNAARIARAMCCRRASSVPTQATDDDDARVLAPFIAQDPHVLRLGCNRR